MSSLYFPLASLLISVLMIIVFFTKKRQTNSETNVYSAMLILNIIETLVAICIIVIAKTYGTITPLYLLNRIDFILLTIWCSSLFVYVYNLSSHKNPEKRRKLLNFINLLFSLSLLVTDFSIINKADSIDTAGLAPTLVGIYCALYAVGMLVLLLSSIFRKKDKVKINKYYPLFVFIILITLSLILRKIWPTMVLEPFMISFINLIMYHTIENPDVKMIEQVNLAKDQAEKANRAKTDFLSSMSHEIRTPLNAIVGFSDCITNSTSLDDAKENAKDIINASNTLLEIVNGILDISKIEAGKLEIVPSPYNAKNTFETLATLITPKMNEKGLDFTYFIAPDLPENLFGDQANIKKIITNILSNAAKYTDSGFVRYEVNCVNTNDDCKLIISVEDSGRGIKKENVDKLFTKFQRLEEDRNTTIEGTGLGLAITKQLVELMGGQIIVHTIYGEGSKFTVILNQKITLEKPDKKSEEVQNTNNKSVDLSSLKILLVDDNELNLKVATKLLNRQNITNITCVDSGFVCLEKINNNENYDLILLDDMMPKMSGVETLAKLKEIPNFNIPTVALTANAISGMKEKYLESGFDDYIPKPIEKDTLIAVLNNVMSLSSKQNSKEEVMNSSEEVVEEIEVIGEDEESSGYDQNYLVQNGVDMDKALELLFDLETYNETLNDFLQNIEVKWNKIKNYKEISDMPNYAIEVHSLKSDSKYLGLTKLADIAYEHELKSKDNDIQFINNHFDELYQVLKDTVSILLPYAKGNKQS